MRLKPPSGLQVVRKEEKEAKLKAFISQELALRAACAVEGATDSGAFLLIARSHESPVVAALRSLSDDLASAGIAVRAIFTSIDTGFSSSPVQADAGFALESQRVARDVRLFEAHEQLILSGDRAWIGDCMRREPAKRDAYERYVEQAPEAVAAARRAFDRLWLAAEVIAENTAAVGALSDTADGIGALGIVGMAPADGTALVATRH